MFSSPFFLNFCLMAVLLSSPGRIFFQSDALKDLKLTSVEGNFSMLDDEGKQVEVMAMEDEAGVLYWHREVVTSVCLTGECKMVNIGLYWYCTGDFMGFEVYGEHLTKTDHSVFSVADYNKLLSVLGDDWSILREYKLSDLVTQGVQGKKGEEGVDGTTGATKKEIAEEAVEGAVYTTFTLWHLAHAGEKEQLSQLTAGLLNKGESALHQNTTLAGRLLNQGDKRYRYFLLELLAEDKIIPSEPLTRLQIEGLNAAHDPVLRGLAIRSLSHADLDHPLVQPELAKIYPRASIDERLRILTALEGVSDMDKALYQVLAADLGTANEWFSIKLLKVLKEVPDHGDEAVAAARELLESDNPLVRKAAEEFIKPK